ncbi:hypothetical protein ACLI09_05300 [Flavobacterium sp. RHBU_24]|uniref:hypothetical protein n=1 Tax=Flavobacterium sp. RHBU_24 TaxID=3391185 RepID=UPI003984E029
MRKTTLLATAVIIMMVLNCLLLFLLYYTPAKLQPGLPRTEPKYIIIDRLEFTPQQVLKYEELIKGHRRSINHLDFEIRTTKKELYSLLSKNEKQRERDSLIEIINGYQKEIEYVHFKHFKDIKMLCTDKQKVLFEQLLPDLSRLFSPRPPMPPGLNGQPEERP